MSTISLEKVSIVHWYPELETHKCGYCKSENGAVSYGMWAEQLTVEDYQNLIDRGWRRSGMYCYKPMMDQTCCPQYTIRCKALDFKPSKSQKKIIKKFNKYLTEGSERHTNESNKQNNLPVEEGPHEQIFMKDKPSILIDYSKFNGNSSNSRESTSDTDISHTQPVDIIMAGSSNFNRNTKSIDEEREKMVESPVNSPKDSFKEGVGADPNKPLCKKAKLVRLERKQQKLLQKGMSLEQHSTNNEPKTLKEFLNEIPADAKHKLEMKLIPAELLSKELENVANIEYQLYKKYQMGIHNDPPEKCSLTGFTRFLISSPLKSFRVRGNSFSVTYGTFHQQYWVDDKLIAVAVLDILPRCVSSVYFFYDPDFRFLTLGTYGALREIQFVESLHASIPAIECYYMGYYIHSCPKMRYKGKFSHSFLLCPETYGWFPIERCIIKLEKDKYSRLNDDLDALDDDICSRSDVDNIKVCVDYSFMVFGNYKRKFGEQEIFDNIGRLIGKKCAANLLFVSSKN